MQVKIVGGPYRVAPDGITVIQVIDGEIIDLPPTIAEPWLERGWAVMPIAKKIEVTEPEKKAEPSAPENKMEKPHNNKSGKRPGRRTRK